jgi:hypothetical protein
VTNKPTVALNSTTTLYLRDWYTGINDPVWTLVSGPGTLTTTTTQLSMTENVPIAQYKAPASQPHGGQGIVIQAQSASNPNLQATVMLQINGGGGPGNGSTFFK